MSKKLDADLLDQTEVEALLRACSRRAPTGIRNAAMIAVMNRCGLRVSEVTALAVKDVDLNGQTLIVQNGKGGKRRVVGIDKGTCALIERWIDARKKTRIPKRAPLLFTTLDGNRIDTGYLRHALPRLARKAGITKRVHAHGLRHAYCVALVREGAPITTIRDLLGHSSIAVTDRYTRRIGASEAVEFAKQRVWNGA